MTGPEHYTAAEQFTITAEESIDSDRAVAEFLLRLAGVHASLAGCGRDRPQRRQPGRHHRGGAGVARGRWSDPPEAHWVCNIIH